MEIVFSFFNVSLSFLQILRLKGTPSEVSVILAAQAAQFSWVCQLNLANDRGYTNTC